MEVTIVDVEEEERKSRRASMREACRRLRETKVGELVKEERKRRRLVEVPYTATLAHTINVLLANDVVAVPVAAPPGRWIGAGGSMILESDPVSGTVRKHYIGMVTMVDILVHIAEEKGETEIRPPNPREKKDEEVVATTETGGDGGPSPVVVGDIDRRMAVQVSSLIGHSLEGLSLWTLNPNTSILDCMEAFSKGVHRALVPLESHTSSVISVELTEASPGYQMLTQMDVLKFLRRKKHEMLTDVLSSSIKDLGAINWRVFSITKYTKVLEALKSMRMACINSVPIVDTDGVSGDGHELLERKGRKLLGTFSATDLRSCPMNELGRWLSMGVVEFKARISRRPSFSLLTSGETSGAPSTMVTCHPETTLDEAMEEAVSEHVHRVWVLDGEGQLIGVVSLTDMLRVVRMALLSVE